MDVLADFLEVAGAAARLGKRLSGGKSWVYPVAPKVEATITSSSLAMYAVADGQGRLVTADTELSLATGDVVFVQAEVEHRIESLSEGTCLLTGAIAFQSGAVGLSALRLAPVLVLRLSDESLANEFVQRLASEMQEERGGWHSICLAIIHSLFIAALRASGACTASSHDNPGGNGWLRGMADPEIGAALKLMHERPEHRWTVAELASELSVSRSAFAARFKSITGRPPLEYLTWWRLQRAAVRLRSGTVTLTEVARVSGYQSEAAFGKAFRREFGISPGQVRRQSMAKLRTPSQLQLEIKKRNPFDVPEQEVALNLLKTAEQLQRPTRALLATHGVVGLEYNILRILRGMGVPLTQEEILNQLIVPQDTIQPLVDRLAAVAWIHDTEDTGRWTISETGLGVLAKLDEPILSIHRRQLSHFSEGELAEFNRLLVKARSPIH